MIMNIREDGGVCGAKDVQGGWKDFKRKLEDSMSPHPGKRQRSAGEDFGSG